MQALIELTTVNYVYNTEAYLKDYKAWEKQVAKPSFFNLDIHFPVFTEFRYIIGVEPGRPVFIDLDDIKSIRPTSVEGYHYYEVIVATGPRIEIYDDEKFEKFTQYPSVLLD